MKSRHLMIRRFVASMFILQLTIPGVSTTINTIQPFAAAAQSAATQASNAQIAMVETFTALTKIGPTMAQSGASALEQLSAGKDSVNQGIKDALASLTGGLSGSSSGSSSGDTETTDDYQEEVMQEVVKTRQQNRKIGRKNGNNNKMKRVRVKRRVPMQG